MMRHKCSSCGRPWRDCEHVSFEDAYATKWKFILGWVLMVVALVIAVSAVVMAVVS